MKPIAIYHEHPAWFRPLFRELERRGLPHVRLDASAHVYEPSGPPPDWSLLFNRMSPSAHLRGNGRAVAFTGAYLEWLEGRGVRVVNGSEAFRTEVSKARQIDLLDRLGLSYPATRVVDAPGRVPEAASGLGFPVLVKANRGGSGAGIRSFADARELREAAGAGELDAGPDGTMLVQERVPARGGSIVRVEVVGGRYLYAIRIHLAGDVFDLCPADLCSSAPDSGGESVGEGEAPGGAGPAVDVSPDSGLRVEAAEPPPEVIAQVERLTAAAGIEVGGVEYLVDDRDGTVRYYDVNALSNFVADPLDVLGFDPHRRLVDWLVERAREGEEGDSRDRSAAREGPVADRCDAATDRRDPVASRGRTP